MSKPFHISSSPHIRSSDSTGRVMYDVILALMPTALFGVWHFGLHALWILLVSIGTAVATEAAFCWLTHRPCTVKDGSAVLTGLLLGLCLSPTVPLYIPFLGSLFAIALVKCAFGGLGQNFMNPALTGRCFLLISFGVIMADFGVDAVSGATPLAALARGETVDLWQMFLGFTNGTIGVSCAAMLLGGIYLLLRGVITWHIPGSYLLSFLIMMGLIGGQGFDPSFLLAHLLGGGVILGAVFMATDYVTSPMLPGGQLLYGVLLGVLTAVFRVRGNAAETISFAILLGNLLVPLIDRLPVPKPFGAGYSRSTKPKVPTAALVLMAVTLIAGAALGVVSFMTRDAIAEQERAAKAAAYAEVVPMADSFVASDTANAFLADSAGTQYGDGAFGKAYINEAVVGMDSAGNPVGYAISVTTRDGYDGTITLSVGLDTDGTVLGLAFTELKETPGMGMRCDEAQWKEQFVGQNVPSFTLIKSGQAAADNEIDTISGASTTSGAVVNAVNAAVDFFNNQLK